LWNVKAGDIPVTFEVDLPVSVEPPSEEKPREPIPSIDTSGIIHQVFRRLVDAQKGIPLANYVVQTFDLGTSAEPEFLGHDTTNGNGEFVLSYATLPDQEPAETRRRLELRVIDAQGKETHRAEIHEGPDQNRIIEIRVPVPEGPAAPSPTINDLAETVQLELPEGLLPFLARRQIHTLADIRKRGGIPRTEDLPVDPSHPAILALEAHADLGRISPDIRTNAELITAGYTSILTIAESPRSGFVTTAHPKMGDFRAATAQISAKAQTGFLNTVVWGVQAEIANGFVLYPGIAAAVFPFRCTCRDCEAAVSPLAYLADLLDYTAAHLEDNNNKINLQFLTDIFRQPFGRLPASCESMDTIVRQVRICIEVLRSYLQAHPPTPARRTALEAAEKNYRLLAYTTLLSKLGVSFEEIRLARTMDDKKRGALADRLGIDLEGSRPDHLDALLLDPAANPAVLTGQALEQLFGLVDTNRDPLANGPVPMIYEPGAWNACGPYGRPKTGLWICPSKGGR
jgi:hypothetical protein